MKVRLIGMSALLGWGCEVTLTDGADDGDSQDDHEGAGGAVPQRVEGGEVGDSGRGVCGDGVPPGLRPPGSESGVDAPGGQGTGPAGHASMTPKSLRRWR